MIITILVLSTSRELAESLLFMLFWKLCWNWFWYFKSLVGMLPTSGEGLFDWSDS